MSTNAITITGNITADPELRALPSGTPVATFTVADTPRHQDQNTGEWKDGETLFQRVAAWNDLAHNVAESLHRGDHVTVTGRLVSKSYTAEGGEKRTSAPTTSRCPCDSPPPPSPRTHVKPHDPPV